MSSSDFGFAQTFEFRICKYERHRLRPLPPARRDAKHPHTGGGYAALVLACIALSTAAVAPADRANTRMAMLVGLMCIQALVIVIYGFFTVSSAVRLDNNNLMESHRLMPLDDFPASAAPHRPRSA